MKILQKMEVIKNRSLIEVIRYLKSCKERMACLEDDILRFRRELSNIQIKMSATNRALL